VPAAVALAGQQPIDLIRFDSLRPTAPSAAAPDAAGAEVRLWPRSVPFAWPLLSGLRRPNSPVWFCQPETAEALNDLLRFDPLAAEVPRHNLR
jgi:hypothetical protein